jgi:predicted dehydrogenase
VIFIDDLLSGSLHAEEDAHGTGAHHGRHDQTGHEPVVLPCRAMNDRTIRVGFVGAGKNTRSRHIPGFRKQPEVELVAVANRSRESGERVAKEFGIARVYDDWRELVRAADVDAVCIGTWPYTHCEMTLAALAAGKHVLCEARMAMDAAEGRRMLEASRRAPSLVTQLVPSPPTLEVDETLTRLIGEGYIGEVLAVELSATQNARFVDREEPLHWRHDVALSGHNVMNMGIWYEAMMRWLGPVRRVMAMGKVAVPQRRDERGTLQDVKVPDHIEILATLRDGAVARLRFSSIAALGPPSEVWIFGSDGTLRLEADARRLWGARRGDKELREIPIPGERRIGWRVEEEFINAVRGCEKVARTTFEDGVRYMEFTDAVAMSAALGRAADVAPL